MLPNQSYNYFNIGMKVLQLKNNIYIYFDRRKEKKKNAQNAEQTNKKQWNGVWKLECVVNEFFCEERMCTNDCISVHLVYYIKINQGKTKTIL